MVADTAAFSLSARSQEDHPSLLALAQHVTRDTPLIQAESSPYIKDHVRAPTGEHRERACTFSDRRCLHCMQCIDKIPAQILHADV